MPSTGELIRSINYVDDMAATLRRITIYIPSMTTEERLRLAEPLRAIRTAIDDTLADLQKAGQ